MKKIAIIGAGVIGCAVGRELSRYRAEIAVFDRETDVAEGTSKANSGIAHAGFDAAPGSAKARFNVRGAKMLPAAARELDFPYRANGALVLNFTDEGGAKLEELLASGRANGVEGLKILGRDEILALEPNVNPEVVSALYAPTSGIVSPYEMTEAYAENAAGNGAAFRLGTEVRRVRREGKRLALETSAGEYLFDAVINCAGCGAGDFDRLFGADPEIHGRRGQYLLTDKQFVTNATLFQLPTEMGKGVLVAPTVHGNVLIGPTAEDIPDSSDTDTTPEGLKTAFERARRSVPSLSLKTVITQFSGVRATPRGGDFYVGRTDMAGYYRASGIESPGLTSAPAIGEYLAQTVASDLGLPENPGFDPVRRAIPRFAALSDSERRALIAKNPLYGRIVCRCENVTEGEIVEAIRRVPGATDLDGVKRRTRAGMGRCQAGFCSARVMEILARELGKPMSEITKKGPGSELISGADKEDL